MSRHGIHQPSTTSVRHFNNTEVIRDVSVDIADGEFCVLVGPSGSGKSTLLRLIAGLEEPTAGQIHIGSRDVTHEPPKKRDIAMVFQSYALYPQMTVRDNMGFGLRLAGVDKKEAARKVDAAAEMLGLTPLLDRFPRQLSGGQRQRVAMGRAIVRQPAVYLFDEPLSNLDAALRVQVRGEIVDMHQRLRTTAVYVTHDQVEAMSMGDRIVVLRDGRVEQTGTPHELYQRPANRFVAGFIGSPAMNLLDGELAANGEFATAGGRCSVLPLQAATAAAPRWACAPSMCQVLPAGERTVPGQLVAGRRGARPGVHRRRHAGAGGHPARHRHRHLRRPQPLEARRPRARQHAARPPAPVRRPRPAPDRRLNEDSAPMAPTSPRPPTMRDVARTAGVSTATVSRYVNGLQRFTEATEARLRDAIDSLGFSVDPVARSMITGRTHTVAVVILDIRNPHFTGIVKGANRKAQQLGYNLLFVDTGERQSAEAGMLRELSRRVDGLIVSSRMPDADLSTLRDLDKPVVFFGRASQVGVHSVSADGPLGRGHAGPPPHRPGPPPHRLPRLRRRALGLGAQRRPDGRAARSGVGAAVLQRRLTHAGGRREIRWRGADG